MVQSEKHVKVWLDEESGVRTRAARPRLHALDWRHLRSRLPRSILSRAGCPGEPVGERSSPKICEDPRFDTLSLRSRTSREETVDHRDYPSDDRECSPLRGLPALFNPVSKNHRFEEEARAIHYRAMLDEDWPWRSAKADHPIQLCFRKLQVERGDSESWLSRAERWNVS
ncbi:hypothetical protein KM043_011449 [Ampulex compressa]|nr:hypothetical protein KM043_011449 [Ampulex compressa]